MGRLSAVFERTRLSRMSDGQDQDIAIALDPIKDKIAEARHYELADCTGTGLPTTGKRMDCEPTNRSADCGADTLSGTWMTFVQKARDVFDSLRARSA